MSLKGFMSMFVCCVRTVCDCTVYTCQPVGVCQCVDDRFLACSPCVVYETKCVHSLGEIFFIQQKEKLFLHDTLFIVVINYGHHVVVEICCMRNNKTSRDPL